MELVTGLASSVCGLDTDGSPEGSTAGSPITVRFRGGLEDACFPTPCFGAGVTMGPGPGEGAPSVGGMNPCTVGLWGTARPCGIEGVPCDESRRGGTSGLGVSRGALIGNGAQSDDDNAGRPFASGEPSGGLGAVAQMTLLDTRPAVIHAVNALAAARRQVGSGQVTPSHIAHH